MNLRHLILAALISMVSVSIMSGAGRSAFRDGDRVVFLGDSITQHGEYPLYLECYLREQFPKWKFTFRNAGWGSDRAWLHQRVADTDMNGDAMLKLTDPSQQEAMVVRMVQHGLKRDVLPLKPTLVTIMYGANEVRDGDRSLRLHLRALREIIDQLRKANCRVILFSAPPEEQGSEFNPKHEQFVAAVRELAKQEKVTFVDIFHPVMQAVAETKKADPSFGYTRDGVHPHPAGHRMIAQAILEGLGFDASKLLAEKSPLLPKVTEKNKAYFHRWREIQIPALLAGKLDLPTARAELAEADSKIAALDAELNQSPQPPPDVVGHTASGSPRREEEAFAIGDRACLFLDDHFIAKQSGFKRTWHQGQPRPEVAIQQEEKNAWERWPHMFGSTLYDPEAKVYRMYYESAVQPSRIPGNSFACFVCYAESKDGKTWTKPKLGLFEDLGSKENNIVIYSAEFPKVFLDPLAKDPSERLKMFVYLANNNLHGGSGECLMASGDGLHWKFLGGFNKPNYARAERGDYTDSFCSLFDAARSRYMAYIRTFSTPANGLGGCRPAPDSKQQRRRAVGISESKQINRGWSEIVHVLEPDDRDDAKVVSLSKDPAKPDWAEHYCMPFFVYGNHYLGMLSLLYYIDGSDAVGGGDLELTFSHDGSTWHRHPDRQTMIAPSNAAPELFPTYVAINGPIEVGDELWLYYTEANGAHPVAPPRKPISQIRAAAWRKDGFVSMDAAGKAMLTTKPVVFDGKELRVNFTAESLRVSLLDEQGKPIKGFEAKDCQPLTGDAVSRKVSWKKKSDISFLNGKPVRLRFDLEKGQLWSFQFAQ